MLTMILGFQWAVAAKEVREEFHRAYPLSESGKVNLDNVNGSIHISTWERNEVKVDAVKIAAKQERLAEIEIQVDASTTNKLSIKTKYPKEHKQWGWFNRNANGRVEYTLTVPRGVCLDRISSVNSEIEIEGPVSETHVSTVNGRVKAHRLAGKAQLSTVNGSLEVVMDQVIEGREVTMDTVNGLLSLTLPEKANADLSAHTVNGSIHTDFKLTVHKNFPISSSLDGQLGTGGAHLRLNTVNGSITVHSAAQ